MTATATAPGAAPSTPEGRLPIVSGASGLTGGARLICEKSFASNLASARTLDKTLHSALEESQIFRIDHLLGKEAGQSILELRLGSSPFKSVWNREHVVAERLASDLSGPDAVDQLVSTGRRHLPDTDSG